MSQVSLNQSEKEVHLSSSCYSLVAQIEKNKNVPIVKPKTNPNNGISLNKSKDTAKKVQTNNFNQSKNSQKPKNDDNSALSNSYIKQGDEFYNGTHSDYTVNFKKAAELYKKAADLGSIQGSIKYGNMLRYGLGIKIDKKEAKRYYELAAQKGDHLGQKLFEIMEYQEKNLPEIPLDNSNSNQAKIEQPGKAHTESHLKPVKVPDINPGAASPRNKK